MQTVDHIVLSAEQLAELELWAGRHEELSRAFDDHPTNELFGNFLLSPTAHEQIEHALLLRERNKAYAATIVLLHWNREHGPTTNYYCRGWLEEFEKLS